MRRENFSPSLIQGVIIALARICRLDLLEKLFGEILVPDAIWREIVVEAKPGSEKIARAAFIHVEKASNRRLATLLEGFRVLEDP